MLYQYAFLWIELWTMWISRGMRETLAGGLDLSDYPLSASEKGTRVCLTNQESSQMTMDAMTTIAR